MSGDWNGWPEDEPDFGGDDEIGGQAGVGNDTPYPQEGFGAAVDGLPEAELTSSEGFGANDDLDVTDGPDGYGIDPHVNEPLEASPAGPEFDTDTATGPQVGFGPADSPIGADPDLGGYLPYSIWPEPVFPEMLDFGELPEPVDGFPWADPGQLGTADAELPDLAAHYTAAPEPAEVAEYAGGELPAAADAWSVLANFPDPATSSLARWWSPGPPR